MGYTTEKGVPIPFGFEGNNVPLDLLAVAARLDVLFSPRTYAEVTALGGSDLWDGRRVFQTDTGALRPFTGLYSYKASTGVWQPLVPTASAAYTPLDLTVGSPPTLGTGGTNTGWYCRFGTLVVAQFGIYAGSPGYVNGTWRIKAPVAFKDQGLSAPDDLTNVGSAYFNDVSVPTRHLVTLTLGRAATLDDEVSGDLAGGTTGQFSSTSPVTIANGDDMAGYLFYEGVEA